LPAAVFRKAWAGALVLAATRACAQDASARFKVAELPGQEVWHDAYTLILTNPSDIAHARDLVSRGLAAGEAIVVARIAAGLDQLNRNWGVQGAPPWHWHISQFLNFADATVEILDGTPTGVEVDPAGWAAYPGLIGFWGYTVVAELPPATCYANCDGSTAAPILNVNDFSCFLNRFATQDQSANCDGSTTPPMFNILDFQCFINHFASGC
jgi:hypothetical protein